MENNSAVSNNSVLKLTEATDPINPVVDDRSYTMIILFACVFLAVISGIFLRQKLATLWRRLRNFFYKRRRTSLRDLQPSRDSFYGAETRPFIGRDGFSYSNSRHSSQSSDDIEMGVELTSLATVDYSEAGEHDTTLCLPQFPEFTPDMFCYVGTGKARRLGSSKSQIIEDEGVEKVYESLPESRKCEDWRLLYATYNDGRSLNTLLRNVHDEGPVLLLAEDEVGHTFGAYISESIKVGMDHFGTGQTFVFTMSPEYIVYNWTQENDFFCIAQGDFLAVGGGDHFALWFPSSMDEGTSGECLTFDSPVLAGKSSFKLKALEIWGFII
eukprot:28542_1